MIILLPPSEGKEPGGKRAWSPASGRFGRALAGAREPVIAALPLTAPTALKVRGAIAAHATLVNVSLVGSPVLPASARYSGVVYQGLDFASLAPGQQNVAQDSIVIVSGLLGLAGLGDPLPDYRAPMDASLEGLGKLAAYWKPIISPLLQKAAKRDVVIDLLTQVHRSALEPAEQNWFTVDLVHSDVTGGHAAKFAKGQLARWLLDHDITELRRWKFQGWTAKVR